jgi:hypothetical protein
MNWVQSWRADPQARQLADRHYNRQKVGATQFVPPGGCVVLATADFGAVWVTSTPIAKYVKHAWAGAWVNSLFRNESRAVLSSVLINEAVAATLAAVGPAPPLGIVSFVDASKTRRKRDPGRCYRRAGWKHVGFTKGGLWVFQQLPGDMPASASAIARRSGGQGK